MKRQNEVVAIISSEYSDGTMLELSIHVVEFCKALQLCRSFGSGISLPSIPNCVIIYSNIKKKLTVVRSANFLLQATYLRPNTRTDALTRHLTRTKILASLTSYSSWSHSYLWTARGAIMSAKWWSASIFKSLILGLTTVAKNTPNLWSCTFVTHGPMLA